MTQINLLPWREKARKARQVRFYIVLGMSSFAAILCVFIIHLYVGNKIAHQVKRNAFLQTVTSQEQTTLNMLDKKMKEKKAIDIELEFIMSLRESSYKAVQLLDELVRVVPNGVFFKKLVRQGPAVTIIGRANSNLEITSLMKSISKSAVFDNADLTEITGKDSTSGEEREFQLKFNQP